MEHLEAILFWVSLSVAVLGLLAFGTVSFVWDRVARWYSEVWAKLAVALFRIVAAVAAVARAFAPAVGEPSWLTTLLLAGVGYFLWEVVAAVGDHKHKRAKEKSEAEHEREIEELRKDRDDAKRLQMGYSWLLSHLRELVNEKTQRIREVVRGSTTSRGTLPQTRRALAPAEQLGAIIELLASLLRLATVSAGGRYNQNFRISLYAEQEDRLIRIAAFDLNTRSHDPSSDLANDDRFLLVQSANPSHAVRCVRESRMLIVADCTIDPAFSFFHPAQSNYLKSLIAFPIADFSIDGDTVVRASLVVDTDESGHFHEANREISEAVLMEFAARLSLEYTIGRLLA